MNVNERGVASALEAVAACPLMGAGAETGWVEGMPGDAGTAARRGEDPAGVEGRAVTGVARLGEEGDDALDARGAEVRAITGFLTWGAVDFAGEGTSGLVATTTPGTEAAVVAPMTLPGPCLWLAFSLTSDPWVSGLLTLTICIWRG